MKDNERSAAQSHGLGSGPGSKTGRAGTTGPLAVGFWGPAARGPPYRRRPKRTTDTKETI
jgi:hypothetical protein